VDECWVGGLSGYRFKVPWWRLLRHHGELSALSGPRAFYLQEVCMPHTPPIKHHYQYSADRKFFRIISAMVIGELRQHINEIRQGLAHSEP
jgi:hypothetical protein